MFFVRVVQLQWNPVITTSVYATPRLYRQISCGNNYFLTVNHNAILLGYNVTRGYLYKIFSPFHDVITDFDYISLRKVVSCSFHRQILVRPTACVVKPLCW
jgi:hypothetical protein